MTTAIRHEVPRATREVFPELIAVRPGGILARVRRTCAEHACECGCVGHLETEGCLVFWCESGEHHLTFRS